MYSTVIWYQLLYSFVFIFSWQETFLRTQLMSNHLQFWNTIGYQYDTSIANDMAKPSQEALMKLFAVSWVNDSQMSFIDIPLFSILIFPLQYASIWTSLSSFLFHKNVLIAFCLEFLNAFNCSCPLDLTVNFGLLRYARWCLNPTLCNWPSNMHVDWSICSWQSESVNWCRENPMKKRKKKSR